MPREYVFRGEGEPFAPNPEVLRKQEDAKREAEQLATKDPPSDDVVADGTLDEIVGDYQVGGLDSFGAESDRR
jgi:hypothetical protein